MSRKPKKKGSAVGTFFSTLLLVAAIGVFCYAGWRLLGYYLDYKAGSDEYSNLNQQYVSMDSGEEGGQAETQDVREEESSAEYVPEENGETGRDAEGADRHAQISEDAEPAVPHSGVLLVDIYQGDQAEPALLARLAQNAPAADGQHQSADRQKAEEVRGGIEDLLEPDRLTVIVVGKKIVDIILKLLPALEGTDIDHADHAAAVNEKGGILSAGFDGIRSIFTAYFKALWMLA